MPENISEITGPEEIFGPVQINQEACALYALAEISEQRQGRTTPYTCSMKNCGITAKNDRNNLTHILKPGLCYTAADSMYLDGSMLPVLDKLGL